MLDEVNDPNLDIFWISIYRIVFSLVMICGIIVNKNLYNTIKKQITGEKGKVFQQIMKSYAVIQSIGWPFIAFWMIGVGILIQNYGQLLPACVYVNCVHIGVFVYMFMRTYVGFNSLVLAVGRFVFVVHDEQVMKWGVETVAKMLIRSSFIIPFLMAFLSNSVASLEYNGWLSQIQDYQSSCYYSTDQHSGHSDDSNGTTNNLFKSPLYEIVHSNFPPWLTSGMYVLNMGLAVILLSNLCEGIIYARCALFVFRSECKETILASLSEESKIKRRRRNIIGIQVTAISWVLEFIGGAIALSRYWLFQTQHVGEWVDRVFALFDFFVCMIPIPLSYLLNEEAIKLAIEIKGWSSVLLRKNQSQE